MSTADQPALVRCTLVLCSLTWILPMTVLGLCLLLIHELGAVDPFSSQASRAGSQTIEIGLLSQFHGHSLTGFTIAIAAFAVFALGSLLALASLYSGGLAMKQGAASTPLSIGVGSSSLYLAMIVGVVIGSSVA